MPVQFIPAYNYLIEDAIKGANEVNCEDVKTKVVGLEHLLAIMLQTNRPKDRGENSINFERGKNKTGCS